MSDNAIATVVYESSTDDKIILGLRGAKYQLHLKPLSQVTAHHHTRIKGIIRADVWKVDFVSKGGAYIEPIYGKPRRIQGTTLAHLEDENSIIIDVWDTPIVAELPERWQARDIQPGTKVAVDIQGIPTFQLAPSPATT